MTIFWPHLGKEVLLTSTGRPKTKYVEVFCKVSLKKMREVAINH